MKKMITFLSLIVLSSGCVSPEEVRDRVLADLEVKYNKKFALHSINMNRDEGNWGNASLMVYPVDDETLRFHVNYNYSAMELTWEDYKGELWNRELSVYTASLLGLPVPGVVVRITSDKSITFNSMKLPYNEKFSGVIKQVNNPVANIQLEMKSENFTESAAAVSHTALSLLNTGFEKVTVIAEISGPSGKHDTLKFKITGKYRSPSGTDLRNLFASQEKTSFKEAEKLYGEASALLREGKKETALRIFLGIVKTYDNPYRFDPYIVLESHYVVQSAFSAAEILDGMGNNTEADNLYKLVTERIEQHEVKAELNDIYRTAVQRVSERRT